MRKLIETIIFIVFICSNTQAQSWCSGGQLITNNGDTISGDIKYKVISNQDHEVSILTKDDIKVFYPPQIKSFSYIDKRNSNRRTFVSGISKNLFVEEIIVSHISLYKQSYNYIITKDSVTYQLDVGIDLITIDDKYYRKEKKEWKGVLIFLMNDEISDITKRMKTFKMSDKSINDLVVEYNTLKSEIIKNSNNSIPWRKFTVGISAGAGISNLIFNTTHSSLNPLYEIYTPTITPSIGVVGNILNPRRNISVNTGVYYSFINYYAHTKIDSYYGHTLYISDINMKTITVPFTVRKSFDNRKFSFFIDCGLLLDFHLLNESYIFEEEVNRDVVDILKESDRFNVSESQFGYMLDCGFLINKNNHEVGVSLQFDEMFNFHSMNQISAKCRTFSLNMLYYF